MDIEKRMMPIQDILQTEGYVHSIESAGTVDGPGLRFVVFLTGCYLRCLYCHNPDTHHLKDGKKVRAREIVEELAQYTDFLTLTGGGLTVTGGEPLVQQDFVTALFKGAKALGVHTALDTSGCVGDDVADALIDNTDLILLDIKSFDAAVYRQITSGELESTLAFAENMVAKGKRLWIRYVLVPELTDGRESIEKLALYVKALGVVDRVEILPFHKMGEAKWTARNLPYTLHKTEPPSLEATEQVRAVFRAQGIATV